MTKLWLTLCIAAGAIMAAAPHAQTKATSSDEKRVTVTGCIERSTAPMPTGTAGTAGAAAPASKFVLAKATSTATSPTGTAGSTNPPSSAGAAQYRLDDAAESKLTPHVGHKVEITGTIDDQAPSATGSSSATSSAMGSPKLKVDTVKMIAPSCSE